MSFNISASEAVLLGCALEEYLQARQDYAGNYFLDFVWNRIGPFSPPIANGRRDRLDLGAVPSDIRWEPFETARVGFAPSWPNSWFLSADSIDFVARFTRDRTSRSLIDHVACFVWSDVAKSIADESRFNVDDSVAWGRAQSRSLTTHSTAEGKTRQGHEDPSSIESAFSALVKHPDNNRSDHFNIGRIIGRILADCERYEVYLLEGTLAHLDEEKFQPIVTGRVKPAT